MYVRSLIISKRRLVTRSLFNFVINLPVFYFVVARREHLSHIVSFQHQRAFRPLFWQNPPRNANGISVALTEKPNIILEASLT
jgi:hypothetical protein